MKKILILLVLSVFLLSNIGAEQIIKTAVVDLELILIEYKKEAKEVMEVLKQLDDVKTEEEKIQKEITKLRDDKLTAQKDKKDSDALKLEKQIVEKEKYLKEYGEVKRSIVKEKLQNLYTSKEFSGKMYDAIRYVAEKNGFSLVLKKSDSSLVIWNSVDIDITNDVIEYLKIKK